MTYLTDLPNDLLSRVADAVETSNHESKHDDLESIRALRIVCKMISQLCAPALFRIVKVLPTPESAARFTKILESDTLSRHVNTVVFQTRMNPDYQCHSQDEYTEPHDFFLEAMDKVGKFSNLKKAELVFSSGCSGGSDRWFNDHLAEQIEFREPVLVQFFAGLNHKDHPATGVRSLSIKNLQDKTPETLTGTVENEFKTNFQQVMSRVNHLSLAIATECYDAAPEHTLAIPEAHDFFGQELNKYWLEPVREQLTYLKLYADTYWGWFPRAELPQFPGLKSMLLGNLSFTHDAQLQWIIEHAETLQKLVFDDCPITIGGRHCEHAFGPDRHIIRSKRPEYIEGTPYGNWPQWQYKARWHAHFDKIKTGLPNLTNFAYGSGPWLHKLAFDEADSLNSSLPKDRYMYFDEGTGPSNWLDPNHEGIYNEGDEEEDLIYKPECDDEDQRALDELLTEVRKRHQGVSIDRTLEAPIF